MYQISLSQIRPNCCRYTFFIVLYPMGVTGELLTIYAALPYVQKTGLYSVTLPNKYNFSFDYHTFLILTMISYIPRKCAICPPSCFFCFFSLHTFIQVIILHSYELCWSCCFSCMSVGNVFVLLSLPPLVFPQLYFHMMRQRKKVLGHVEDYSKVE